VCSQGSDVIAQFVTVRLVCLAVVRPVVQFTVLALKLVSRDDQGGMFLVQAG
jgi:hypothetical protein